MKPFLTAAIVFSLTLAACQLTPEQQQRNTDAVGAVVGGLDRNGDGVLTNTEVGGVKNDPMFWTMIGTALLSLFGVTKAREAAATAKKNEAEADEQWTALAKNGQIK